MANLSHAGNQRPPDAGVRSEPPALALFEPDIAANVAAVIRLAACLAVPVHLIEPLGFVLDRRRLRRVAMDYALHATLVRHPSFAAFESARRSAGRRLILLTTRAAASHLGVAYRPGDLLLLGRESTGAPPAVHAAADLCVRVPLAAATRSLNLVTAAAIVLGEALRQLDAFPGCGGERG